MKSPTDEAGPITPGPTQDVPAAHGIPILDDATRPTAPPCPDATPAQRAKGRHLQLIHRHHRDEMAAVRAALDHVLSGSGAVAAISDTIASLSMAENYRRFGNLCGSQCRLIQMHHDIEERHMFPRLRQDMGLWPVLDRLSAEHQTVHALLGRLLEMSRALISRPTREGVRALAEVYEVFDRIVASHFGYEERELEAAIGVYDAL